MKHLMYYGMTHNPFDQDNNATLETIDYREMTARLNYLKETKGIGLFTGNPGVGKTYTIRQFVEGLNKSLYRPCYFSMSTIKVNEFYRQLAVGLGIEPRYRKVDLFHQIQDRIDVLATQQKITPIIILDEAQYLHSSVLQDITMLLNFHMDSAKPCIIILVGLPSLATTLSRAVLEPLRQRISTQYQIIGMEEKEIEPYITHKLESSGRSATLFEASAITALKNSALGSMRRLNTLVTQALIIGESKELQSISADIIFLAHTEITIG